jgi:hypothetical protein
MKWLVAWALALVVIGSAPLYAAPRSKGKAQNANAKTVDVFKALTDKQVDVQVVANTLTSATITITNLSQEPLNVKVPLAVGAVPQAAPQGAGQGYYLTAYGTNGAPPPVAVSVSPFGSAGVDKRSRKTGVKTAKKKGDEAKEEKKDDEAKKADEKKDTESLEASVLLAPGASQPLSSFTLGLNPKTQPAAYGQFSLAELDKVSEATELKPLLEKVGQGTVPRNMAQILAWHYGSRLSWDEMAQLVTPVDLQLAQQCADFVEGRTATAPAATTGKKKKKYAADE